MRPGKERKTLAFRKGTSMSEWYALHINEFGKVVRAVRLPDTMQDATQTPAYYLSTMPGVEPEVFNDSPEQFYASDTAQLLSRSHQ